jgi:5'-nucleotidase
MNILITNDDGIASPGLIALARALKQIGDVLVVAPDKQQSGVGSCISLHNDMSIRETDFPVSSVKAYMVGGTPTDCVMLGLRRLATEHIDMLVSGINSGPNVGRDILYSGTVMATLQGHYRKIPSIAVSLFNENHEETHDYSVTGQFIKYLVLKIHDGTLRTDAILNVNVPNLPAQKIQGVHLTRTASTGYVSLSSHRHGNEHKYTLELDTDVKNKLEKGTDIWAIHQGYISVTPLQFNLTHLAEMPGLQDDLVENESWQ